MRLWRIGSVIIFVAWSGGNVQPAVAQRDPTEPAIRDVRPVVFPAYDAYQGIARYAPTREMYSDAIGDTRFVMERVTYQSDGLDVYAYLYTPTVLPKDEKRPVVVFNRGSYVRGEFSPEVLMLGNRLARQGYIVVAPMLRAAVHRVTTRWAAQDLHDLFNIIPVLKALPYVDSERVFLYGESRGGMMCLLAAKDGFPARAMAVYGTISDMGLFIGVGNPARQLAPQIWPGFPANEPEITESRSAIRWPDRINVPVLIMHGADDGDVSPLQATRLAAALEERGKAYELKIFYGEKHVLTGRAEERDQDTVNWFRRFDVRPSTATKP